MRDILVAATRTALAAVDQPRYYASERGFQGRFNVALHDTLSREGILRDSVVLEEEYQKGTLHGTSQRPDIILHLPREESGAGARDNNLAVWALKRHATARSARSDFAKLDRMFNALDYPVGFFINIDASDHQRRVYNGRYPNRIVCFAVRLLDRAPTIAASEP